MLKQEEIQDLLGEERVYEGKKGFIHADIKKGIEIKPLDEENNADFLLCFDYIACKGNKGEEEADKLFRSLLLLFRNKKEMDRWMVKKETNEGVGVGPTCPF